MSSSRRRRCRPIHSSDYQELIRITDLEFIAFLISSLAWPAAIVTIILVFKKPLLGVVGNLKSFRWGKAELVVRNFEELQEANKKDGDQPKKFAGPFISMKPPPALGSKIPMPDLSGKQGQTGSTKTISPTARAEPPKTESGITFRSFMTALAESMPSVVIGAEWRAVEIEIDSALERIGSPVSAITDSVGSKIKQVARFANFREKDTRVLKLLYSTHTGIRKSSQAASKITQHQVGIYKNTAARMRAIISAINL